VGRVVGALVVTQCDRSSRAEWCGGMCSWVGTSLATMEEKSWNFCAELLIFLAQFGELGIDGV